MEWIDLHSLSQLEEIDRSSAVKPVVLFKHSTRCSVSSMAWGRMQRAGEALTGADCYYLDLLAHRDVSQAIAERYGVQHESPQLIVVRNGKAVWDESHMGITAGAVGAALNASA